MKLFFLTAACALCVALAACNNGPTKEVPAGQLSAKVIHNPRSAGGINPAELKESPVMVFADTSHNFGWMGEGEKVEHEFSFKNTGKSPLIIAGASVTCGCTVPEFSREPIPPGGSGSLKVTFSSAGKQGHVLKTITVSSNAFPAVQILTITADIKKQAQ